MKASWGLQGAVLSPLYPTVHSIDANMYIVLYNYISKLTLINKTGQLFYMQYN